jgi:hypothetical protein
LPQECRQVLLLFLGQLQLQHQVEELDSVLQRQAAAVVPPECGRFFGALAKPPRLPCLRSPCRELCPITSGNGHAAEVQIFGQT